MALVHSCLVAAVTVQPGCLNLSGCCNKMLRTRHNTDNRHLFPFGGWKPKSKVLAVLVSGESPLSGS